jgi:hypothetical protein
MPSMPSSAKHDQVALGSALALHCGGVTEKLLSLVGIGSDGTIEANWPCYAMVSVGPTV